MNELLRIGFLAFTWIDLVDVLLITVLFYVVYHTLQCMIDNIEQDRDEQYVDKIDPRKSKESYP